MECGGEIVRLPFLTALFFLLDGLPCPELLFPAGIRHTIEDMRVTADHFVRNDLCNIVEGEQAFFLRKDGMKHDLQEQIAKLFFQILGVAGF